MELQPAPSLAEKLENKWEQASLALLNTIRILYYTPKLIINMHHVYLTCTKINVQNQKLAPFKMFMCLIIPLTATTFF